MSGISLPSSISILPQGHDPTHLNTNLSIPRAESVMHTSLTPSQREQCDRFLLPPKKDYQHQYSKLYQARLRAMKKPFGARVQPIILKKNELIASNASIDSMDDDSTLTQSQLSQPDGSVKRSRTSMGDGSRRRRSLPNTPIILRRRIPDCVVNERSTIIGVTYKDIIKKPSTLENFQQYNNVRDDTRYLPEFNHEKHCFEYYSSRNYCSEEGTKNSDTLALEDDQGRVNLLFTNDSIIYNADPTAPPERPSITTCVSGMVIAVEGHLLETGDFLVEVLYFPSLTFTPLPTEESPLNPQKKVHISDGGPCVALMADLDLSSIAVKPSTAEAPPETQKQPLAPGYVPPPPRVFDNATMLSTHDLLTDFLTGSLLPESSLTSTPSTPTLSSSITQSIIVGNLLNIPHHDHFTDRQRQIEQLETQHKKLPKQQLQRIINAFKASYSGHKSADRFLTRLCSTMNVTLVPSTSDPSNYSLPQQPLHPCLFPLASTYSTLHGQTNPSQFYLATKSQPSPLLVCATDGVAVANITKFSGLPFLSAALLTLRCRHLAPTAPDTLPAYPQSENDLFAISNIPDIYIVGKAPAFQMASVRVADYSFLDPSETDITNSKIVTVVCVPSFAKTKTIVLMDITTRRFTPISFQIDCDPTVNPDALMFASTLADRDGDPFDSWDSVKAVIDFGSDLNEDGDME